MMDESKTDKSCIILVRVFDPEVGDVRTRFLDMPVVNEVTAANLFDTLKSSPLKRGLDFKNDVNEGCGQERAWWLCGRDQNQWAWSNVPISIFRNLATMTHTRTHTHTVQTRL